MKKMKTQLLAIWKDESAQGMAEYALLLVVVIAIAAIFKDKITSTVRDKMGAIGDSITKFTP